VVGSREISRSDLEAEVLRRKTSGQTIPPKAELLEELITHEALLVRALQLGLDRDPQVRRAYENSLISQLKEHELRPQLERISVPPDRIRSRAVKEKARQTEQIHLAVLQLSTNSRMAESRRDRLRDRLAEAREKAQRLPIEDHGFGALAIDYSDHQPSRYAGGDCGWFRVGLTNSALPAEVLAAAVQLRQIGEISPVIQTGQGYSLVRLMEQAEAGENSLAALEPVARHRLLNEERKRAEALFIAEVRQRAGVQIRPESLQAVQVEPPDANPVKSAQFSVVR
jgi:hypothetical protein